MKGDLEAILDLTGKLSEIEFRAKPSRPASGPERGDLFRRQTHWFHWGCSP
jgi:hypothetical protein